MTMPSALFLDTSVLDAVHYNFTCEKVSTLVDACTRRRLVLVVPDPIEREVRRHLRERASEELLKFRKSAREFRSRAAFLRDWSGFPEDPSDALSDYKVERLALNAWEGFLRQFDVSRLSYDGLDMMWVMDWHDSLQPPFGPGNKSGEFPDAIALSLLHKFSQEKCRSVAVVTRDKLFLTACDRFPSLMGFDSLPALTELLLADDEAARIDKVKQSIESALPRLIGTIGDELQQVTFEHAEQGLEITQSDVEVAGIDELHVVALGYHECTVTFHVDATVRHLVGWGEWDESGQAWVEEDPKASAIAKIRFDDQTGEVREFVHIEIDDVRGLVETTPFGYP